jgi:hypothetical protein
MIMSVLRFPLHRRFPGRRSLVALACVTMVAAAGTLRAQAPQAGAAMPLTMDQAVAMALEANLGMQSERLNAVVAGHAIAAARASFLPTLDSSLGRRTSKSIPFDFTQGAADITSTSVNISGSVRQALPWFGSGYSVNWTGSRSSQEEMGQQQQHPRQTLFARIEELIDQVRFDPTIARQQIGHEQRRKRRLGVEHPKHGGLLNAHQRAVGECRGRRHAQRLTGQTALPKKSLGLKERDHRFLALRRDDGELHLPVLDIEHRVGSLALLKDRVLLLAGHDRSSSADFGEKRLRIERVLVGHNYPLSLGGATMSWPVF